MEISHQRDVLDGFNNCKDNVINHMKGFNELYIFLNDSLENISEIMVVLFLLLIIENLLKLNGYGNKQNQISLKRKLPSVSSN